MQWEKVDENPSVYRGLRSVDKGVLKTFGKSKLSDSTFVNDLECHSGEHKKNEINKFVKTLTL